MSVDRNRFNKYSMLVPTNGRGFDQVHDLKDGNKAICIVPAPFSVGGYINDYRYHRVDEEYEANELVVFETLDNQMSNTRFISRKYHLEMLYKLTMSW